MIFKGDRQLTPALTDILDDTAPKNNKTYSSNKINSENDALNTAISNETTRATTKENELNTAITNETTRATTKENELNTSINNEVTRATNKENELNTAISNEVTRATNKENELNTSLSNEVTRATNKENELNTAIANEVTRATNKENQLNTAITNKLNWNYVGILSASSGSVLTVGDDWTELCTVMRVSEGSNIYNLTNVTPKNGFTQGSPTGNNTFIGFNWNESYNAKIRLGLTGSGNSRQIKLNYSNAVGWIINGIYVLKR